MAGLGVAGKGLAGKARAAFKGKAGPRNVNTTKTSNAVKGQDKKAK